MSLPGSQGRPVPSLLPGLSGSQTTPWWGRVAGIGDNGSRARRHCVLIPCGREVRDSSPPGMQHHCSQGKEPEFWVLVPLLSFFSSPPPTHQCHEGGLCYCLVFMATAALARAVGSAAAPGEPGSVRSPIPAVP